MAIANSIRTSLENSSWIREMFEVGERLKSEKGLENVFDFSIGNPILEPPKEVHIELLKLLKSSEKGIHRYMPNAGYYETRSFIAGLMRNETGLSFKSDDIVMTVGAGGGLNVIFKALLDPGDEVLAMVPFFVEYKSYVNNHHGILSFAKTTHDFQLDLEAVENALNKKTKIVIINSPNNPTGAVYSQESIDKLSQLLRLKAEKFGHPIYLIADDIYRHLVFDGIKNCNILQSYKNSILVNSHSKDLGLAGERIGYIAIHPEIFDINSLRQGLIFSNRILGFVNAPAMMQKILPFLGNSKVDISLYENLRNKLFSMITDLGFEAIKPQGAFYIFPKSPEIDDIKFVKKAQEENILVVPGSGFGMKGFFRISLCTNFETINNSQPGFEKLAKYYGL
tara:strand:+ start:116 stop:1300 length:1185 start_codon:yes stop_codon:yes gene_type:complete